MTTTARSTMYLSEQEDLEDPPALRPGAYVTHSDEVDPALTKKKSLFSFPSLKWSGSSKPAAEKKYDAALYSFGKSTTSTKSHSIPASEGSPTLSSSNLEDLNSRLKSFKSSRTLSLNHGGKSFEEHDRRTKIPMIFDNHFTYTKSDISELLSGYGGSGMSGQYNAGDDNLQSMEEGGTGNQSQNQNPLIQSLKTAIKTMSSEIETLEEKCIDIEDRYMEATLQASKELQQSMNVLFQYQQKAQKLDESKQHVHSLKDDLKAVKQRLIEKEKERRTFKSQCEEQDALIKQQTCEIAELNKILGESSEDLAQMKIDAKYANTVMVELNACKHKNKSLKDEVIRLRSLQGSTRSHAGTANQHEQSDEEEILTADSVMLDSIVVGLDDLYQDMNVEQKDESYKELVAERDQLLEAVAVHQKAMESMEQEHKHTLEILSSTQSRLSDLLEAHMSEKNDDSTKSKDMEIQMAELNSEREQRIQLEALLIKEKRSRQVCEEKFSKSDSEWKALITEVDQEMKSSHLIIENLQQTKSALSKEIESLKNEKTDSVATTAMTVTTRELENRLVQAFADTRKAHVLIQDLRATPSFSIRVFVEVADPLETSANMYVIPNQDQTSLVLKDPDDSDIPGRKYVFDRVFTPSSHEKLMDGLDEYIKHAVDGKQTSIISHGLSDGNKTDLMFGTSPRDGNGAISIAFMRLVAQLKALENKEGWAFEVKVSFVRILEEDILDLYAFKGDGETKSTHEIKRTSDGSTIITNLQLIEVDIRNEREVKAILNDTVTARRVCSDKVCSSSEEEWQADCVQSHFVFTVMLKGTNYSDSGRVVEGKLSFVELAGDDGEEGDDSSLATTGTNKAKRSLQCFNDIITSISKRQGHIPYRNTKITYVLQPSFSPNGKSILICGLRRDQSHASAYRALQFANKVFHCSISPTISQSGGSTIGGVGSVAKKSMASAGSSVRSLGKDGKSRSKIKSAPKPNTSSK